MPKLRNHRHEIFAVELAAANPPLRAYLAAGYKPARGARFNALRLRNAPEIRARVNELREAEAKVYSANSARCSTGQMNLQSELRRTGTS